MSSRACFFSKKKMTFIKANNLSGAFLWSLDLDDFDGTHCDQELFPLMNTIKSELNPSDYYYYYSDDSSNQSSKNYFILHKTFIIIFFNVCLTTISFNI